MVATRFWSGMAAMAACMFPTFVPAQGTWASSPTSGTPPLIAYHAAVYDTARQRLVAFGGFDPVYAPQLRTWCFDSSHWQAVSPAVSPPPRGGHAMVFDCARQVVVMHGGRDAIFATAGLDDTWEFDGSTWTQRLPALVPPARFEHAMAYDLARSRTVMFGGRSSMTAVLGDTWIWDGTSWTTVAGGPPPRAEHAMCYDIQHDRTVLFGGVGPALLGDTWEWDGTAWQARPTSPSPAPRAAHAMAYDLARGVAVMQGGSAMGNETWEWDGTSWTQGQSTPWANVNHALVFDTRLNRVTLACGIVLNPFQFASDVATYGLPSTGSYAALGQGCANTAGMPVLTSPVSAAPGPMIGTSSMLFVTPAWHRTFFVFGWSDTVDGPRQLPLDLSALGMPGCSLQVSQDAVTSVQPTGSVAAITTATPNDPFLAGRTYYVQAFTLDLQVNPGGFAATNHLLATIGRP